MKNNYNIEANTQYNDNTFKIQFKKVPHCRQNVRDYSLYKI